MLQAWTEIIYHESTPESAALRLISITMCCSGKEPALLERAAAIEPTLSRITFYLTCPLCATPRAVFDIAHHLTTPEIAAFLFMLPRGSQIQIYARPFQRFSTCICNSIARNCVVNRTISHFFFWLSKIIQSQQSVCFVDLSFQYQPKISPETCLLRQRNCA